MLLAIDVGNTDTKLGFYARNAAGALVLERDWRFGTSRRRTADEFGLLFATLFQFANLASERIGAIAISSVVPQTDASLALACRSYIGCDPLVFAAATQSVIAVTTERPRELGSDLLAAAIAGRAGYGAPLVVLGFGTATTFSAISRGGEFLGTAIAPGINVSVDALVARTAKLPQVPLEAPPSAIGRDTVSAMQAGIVYGTIGQTEGLVARIRAEIGADARVVATGGLAGSIAKHTAVIDAVEPHLVLDGLRIFYEKATA